MTAVTTAGTAVHELFAGLIDDAGLFPPARLPMQEAVEAHLATRRGPHGWMVSRFICPASRLDELAGSLAPMPDTGRWRVSVICDRAVRGFEGVQADLTSVEHVAPRLRHRVTVELLELPLPVALTREPAQLQRLLGVVGAMSFAPSGLFLEVPFAGDWASTVPQALAAVAATRAGVGGHGGAPLGVKIRCGGLTADAFPTPEQVTLFVATAADLGLPFKATAGLHHPVRHVDAATGLYQHGFLNLLVATVLLTSGRIDRAAARDLIADEDSSAFVVTPESAGWRGTAAGVEAVRAGRRLYVAHGSCSVSEPVHYLVALGLLPQAA